ncbi:hypothetical protein [Jeotgalicoccus sp. S0W5]|uniref:hypothetical protein n=1 Tax=Jeotgalicoccus sp. S0W5 TaxID=2527874 RepID=UPI0014152699|nr:hypothetical protein [Jeotgalicoccus sp. S0W5]
MGINRLEIGKNFDIFNINDLNSLDVNHLDIRNRDQNLKLEIHLMNLEMLKQFENVKLLNVKDLHMRISFTKQIYLLLNSVDMLNNCIIKSVSIIDMIIVLEVFTVKEMTEFIYQNNMKVLEHLNYISNDIQIHSKNHEILYQANYILKELHKSDNKVKNIKGRIDELSEYMNS